LLYEKGLPDFSVNLFLWIAVKQLSLTYAN
jgi:hypothetical protein